MKTWYFRVVIGIAVGAFVASVRHAGAEPASATLPRAAATAQISPADPDLIPEARRLLDYMVSVQGKGIITGVSRKGPFPAALQASGREPALFGTDFYGWSSKYDERYHANVKAEVDQCRSWWQTRGGIVQVHCHWGMPTKLTGTAWTGKNSKPHVDLRKLVVPGTEEYKAFFDDLKVTADYLKQLADARVPVLWRPFHEIDGNWFWWTDAENPENTAALWRQMFQYLVKERKIHNLIWVYNAAHVANKFEGMIRQNPQLTLADEIAYRRRFYPGAQYVDIASIDTYGNKRLGWAAPRDDSRKKAFELMQGVAPGKHLAIGEDAGMLNPDMAKKDAALWLYTMAWWVNDPEWTRYALNHDHMITLDELPLFVKDNVAPSVRVLSPADGKAMDAGTVEVTGLASDRNGNLAKVAVFSVSNGWIDWRDVGQESIAKELQTRGRCLGEASLDAQGRWSFSWKDVPPGYHQLIAAATDDKGLTSYSNTARITAGIKDLASGRLVVASSKDRWGGPAENAVDGDLWTAWWADRTKKEPQWIQVDLGAPRTIGAVVAFWWKACAKDYTVQVSEDGADWRTVATVEKRPSGGGYSDLHRFAPARARYVRLHCTKPAVTWMSYAVFHLGVYEQLP